MSKTELRIVSECIAIVENRETYENSIALIHKFNGSPETQIDGIAHLWQVVLSDNSIHYVIACDESAAIGQASCLPCAMGSIEAEHKLETEARAIKLPLRIRGWGRTNF